MIGEYFGHNLSLKPVAEARVSLDDIYYTYGYGVYETLKVRAGRIYFLDEHIKRLFESARILAISHQFGGRSHDIQNHLEELVRVNQVKDCNIKVLLIGSGSNEANLYIVLLPPLFVPRNQYREGVTAISFEGERAFPNAKSLNMLMSAMAFKGAQAVGAYDALLVDRAARLREGTRTNIFYLKDSVLFTPPDDEVLLGVTRWSIIECFKDSPTPVHFRSLALDEVRDGKIDALFVSSTSTKIVPVRSLDGQDLSIPGLALELVKQYATWLDDYGKSL